MFIGIDFRQGDSRYSILGEQGELLEHGKVRSTEAGFRGRFASLPPSLIAVPAGRGFAWAAALLASLGHELIVCGELPAGLRPAVAPLVELLALQSSRCLAAPSPRETRTVVLRRSAEASEAGLLFMVDVEDLLGHPAVSDAWYFVGPLTKEMRLAALAGLAEVEDRLCCVERALRLHQLWEMGEIGLPRGARVAAA
jgi:hypothetical protein